ncbi:uncharacterized protein LOC144425739 [Styela clava]
MENEHAVEALISKLRRESGNSNEKQKQSYSNVGTGNRPDSEILVKPEKSEENKSSKPHPKAVGDLLKLLQSDKSKFYEEPSKQKSELKIFTPSYGRTLHDNSDYYEHDGWEPETKKKKAEGDPFEFYCDLCNISCTSQIVLDTHLIGKKHLKNVNKLKQNTLAFRNRNHPPSVPSHGGKVAEIQKKFEQLSEKQPVVGLEYVTEYQRSNGASHRYFCELCEYRGLHAEILDHVITRNHRLRYMRSHFFDIYYKITNFPSFKNMMRPSEADKLLYQHSSFVVRIILKGNIRFCKVRAYYGEQNISIERQALPPGKIHPSQHKDLPKAEALLLEGEAKELRELEEQRRLEKEKIETEKRAEAERVKRENIILSRRLQMSSRYPNESVAQLNPADILAERRAQKLDQQEQRILNALKQLKESSGNKQMTLEEINAQDKLQRLLIGIRGERKRNLLKHIGKLSSDVEADLAFSNSYETEGFHSERQTERTDRIQNREQGEQYDSNDNAAPVEHSAANASSITKTRQEVEEKIFQALNNGSLAPLAEAFKNNPQLQAGLKEWEKGQDERSESSSSEDRSLKKPHSIQGSSDDKLHRILPHARPENSSKNIDSESSSDYNKFSTRHRRYPDFNDNDDDLFYADKYDYIREQSRNSQDNNFDRIHQSSSGQKRRFHESYSSDHKKGEHGNNDPDSGAGGSQGAGRSQQNFIPSNSRSRTSSNKLLLKKQHPKHFVKPIICEDYFDLDFPDLTSIHQPSHRLSSDEKNIIRPHMGTKTVPLLGPRPDFNSRRSQSNQFIENQLNRFYGDMQDDFADEDYIDYLSSSHNANHIRHEGLLGLRPHISRHPVNRNIHRIRQYRGPHY